MPSHPPPPHVPERPTMLSIGIALQALHAVLAAFLYGLGGLVAAGALGISLAEVAVFQVWPLSVLAAVGAALFAFAVGFYLFVLYTCWRAWEGERTWLWVLIVVSMLGLISTGPLSVIVGVMTIVGAWQHLEALDGRR